MERTYKIIYKSWCIIACGEDRKKANYKAYQYFKRMYPVSFREFTAGITSTTLCGEALVEGSIYYDAEF